MCISVDQTVKAFLPWMMDNNYGYIVEISSVLAFTGVAGFADYCASKSAVVTFAESLRFELMGAGKTGITVSCVCPYHISDSVMFSSLKTRVSWLLPSLRMADVVDRVVRAVKEKQFLVITPRHFYFTNFYKRFVRKGKRGVYLMESDLSLSLSL